MTWQQSINAVLDDSDASSPVALAALLTRADHLQSVDPVTIARAVAMLDSIAKRLNKLAINYCNRELTTRENKALDRLEDQAQSILSALDLKAEINKGDPRGFAIRIYLPDGRSNSFGGEIWGL